MLNASFSIPTEYDVNNLITNIVSPNTVHCRNTALFGMFRRYLLQEVFAIYKWTMPEKWDPDFFQYVLFGYGFVVIVDTEEFGVIPQWGTLGGYNVFYRPAYAIVSNPLIRKTIQADIGKQCSIIKLMPDYRSIMDLVDYYADKLALTSETIDINLCNAMVSTVFGAEGKTEAEALKKMYDKIRSGDPAVVIGKKFFRDDGTPNWQPFQANVKNTYIVPDLLADFRKIKEEFLTAIGVPNANTDKRERLNVPEVESNNVETRTKIELWFDSIQRGIKQTKVLFGDMDLSVSFRYDAPEMNKEPEEGRDK